MQSAYLVKGTQFVGSNMTSIEPRAPRYEG